MQAGCFLIELACESEPRVESAWCAIGHHALGAAKKSLYTLFLPSMAILNGGLGLAVRLRTIAHNAPPINKVSDWSGD